MIRLTIIARLTDGMPLASKVEEDERELFAYRDQAKKLCKALTGSSPQKATVFSDKLIFHYYIQGNVVYLTLCDRAYPAKLAFHYLETLAVAFDDAHGDGVASASRDYCFVKFERIIGRTKKLYMDSRTSRNTALLNDPALDTSTVVRRDLDSMLFRGGRGTSLAQQPDVPAWKKRQMQNRSLNQFDQLVKFGPLAIIAVVVLLFFIIYLLYF